MRLVHKCNDGWLSNRWPFSPPRRTARASSELGTSRAGNRNGGDHDSSWSSCCSPCARRHVSHAAKAQPRQINDGLVTSYVTVLYPVGTATQAVWRTAALFHSVLKAPSWARRQAASVRLPRGRQKIAPEGFPLFLVMHEAADGVLVAAARTGRCRSTIASGEPVAQPF